MGKKLYKGHNGQDFWITLKQLQKNTFQNNQKLVII